jgi:hypothetical protein
MPILNIDAPFCMIDDRGDDLFDPHLMQDVGYLVLADLQRNRESVQERLAL